MSTNAIFVILASIVVIALVIYLIAVKKGRQQTSLGATSTKVPEPPKEKEDEL